MRSQVLHTPAEPSTLNLAAVGAVTVDPKGKRRGFCRGADRRNEEEHETCLFSGSSVAMQRVTGGRQRHRFNFVDG